jgi:hypothetical protein
MNEQLQLGRDVESWAGSGLASVLVRRMQPEDAEDCGRIGFEAHRSVAAAHNVPSEQPSVEFAVGMIRSKVADPLAHGFVAERRGRVVGSVLMRT